MANVFLTLLSNRSEYGTVNSNQIDPSGYEPPQTLHITATPVDSNFAFSHWSDGDLNSSRDYVLSQDTILTAYFYRKKNLLDRVAVAIENLVNKAGLDRFWDNLKSWLSSSDGASRIGFDKDDTTFDSETVQGALQEVKAQADTNGGNISTLRSDLENDYVKRTPDDVLSNPTIFVNGTISYNAIASGTRYSNDYTYFYNNNGSYDMVSFTEVPAASTTYDSNKTYYKFDILTGEYSYFAVADSNVFDANKSELYYIYDYANSKTWDEWLVIGLYTRTASGNTSSVWNSNDHQPHTNGMKHSGVMTVTTGFNNGGSITDLTLNKSLGRVDAKDKYGQGTETITVMVVKGHNYKVTSWSGGHGNGLWEQITLTLFGD